MEVIACKRKCKTCTWCNAVEDGIIDCFYGTYIDPPTATWMEPQTNLDNFHKCDKYVEDPSK